MYYEEKIINGVMHWRGSPDDEFTPYTIEELSRRYSELKATEQFLRAAINGAVEHLRPYSG